MFSLTDMKLFVNGSHSIMQLMSQKKEKNLILDPFSSIVRLAILSYKREGCKISIYNNKITYHEPHILQGPIRWTNGDNRNDLHNLYNPILKSLEWFSKKNSKMNYIFRKAILGLKLLMLSYTKNSVIHHSLSHYAETIENELNEVIIDDTQPESEVFNTLDDIDTISKELLDIWTKNDIEIVYNMLLEIEKYHHVSDENNVNNYVDVLEQFLYNKDMLVSNICVEKSTIL
tara:strand:- start:1118 stop:1810 length:693 start_codon:yes stop_codon:yes gene_type:complete